MYGPTRFGGQGPRGPQRPQARRLEVRRLPEKLEAAGYRSAGAFYARIRSEIAATFEVEDPAQMKKAERAAAMVWAMARRAGVFGPKPESLLFSEASSSLYIPPSPTLFRVKDHWKRIGLVYWVQRRRYWTMKRFRRDLAVGQPIPIPTVGEMLEEKLRKRVYRLGRPRPLERVLYRLDRDGVFCP